MLDVCLHDSSFTTLSSLNDVIYHKAVIDLGEYTIGPYGKNDCTMMGSCCSCSSGKMSADISFHVCRLPIL